MAGEPFKPAPRKRRMSKRHIMIELDPVHYGLVKGRAALRGISMKEYVRQALSYAMDNEG